MKRTLRFLGMLLAGLLASATTLLLCANLWLDTGLARELAREIITYEISELMVGELRIEEIEALNLDRAVIRGAEVYDPQGERVIRGERVEIGLDLLSFFDNQLHFRYARLTEGELRLISNEEGTPSFLDAFGSPDEDEEPDPTSNPLRALVEGIVIEDLTVVGQLIDVEGLRLEGASVRWKIESQPDDSLLFTFYSATGRLTAPFPFDARLDSAYATVSTDPFVGARMHAVMTNGAEQLGVNLTSRIPEGESPESTQLLDVLVNPDPVNVQRLHQVGFEWAEPLRGNINGHVRFFGLPSALELRAQIQTEGGPLTLRGDFNDGFGVRAVTEDLHLQPIIRQDIEIRVGGTVELEQRGESSPTNLPQLTADLDALRYAGFAVPALHIEGEFEEEFVRLNEITAPYVGGSVRGRGKAGFDGSVSLDLSARIPNIGNDPNIQRFVAGARGNLRGDIRISLSGDEDRSLTSKISVSLGGLRYAGLTANSAEIEATLGGRVSRPIVDLSANMTGLQASPLELGSTTMTLRGRDGSYDFAFNASPHPSQRLRAQGNLSEHRRGWMVNIPELTMLIDDIPWRGVVRDMLVGDRGEIQLAELNAQAERQRIQASGVYDERRGNDLSIRAENLEIGPLTHLFSRTPPPISGALDGVMHIRGTGRSPVYEARLNLYGAEFNRVPGVQILTEATYQNAEWRGEARASVGSGSRLDFDLRASTTVPFPTTEDQLRRTNWAVNLDVEAMELGTLGALLPEEHQITGRVTGRASVNGHLGDLRVDILADVADLLYAEYPALAVQLEADYSERSAGYEDHSLSGHIRLQDEHGPLLEVHTQATAALTNWINPNTRSADALGITLNRLSFLHPSRPLGTLPGPMREGIPPELFGAALLASGNFQERDGRLAGAARAGLEYNESLNDRPCGNTRTPRASIRAELSRGVTRIEAVGRVDQEEVIRTAFEMETPIEDWIRNAEMTTLPTVQFDAVMPGFPLDEVPLLCEYAAGPLEARLQGFDIFSNSPRAFLGVAARGFQVRRVIGEEGNGQVVLETPLMSLGFESQLTAQNAEITLTTNAGSNERVDAVASFPIEWTEDDAIPSVPDDAPLRAEFSFEEAPLALLLAAVPDLSSVSGFVNGRTEIAGTLSEPTFDGTLEVDDGSLTLQALGQSLEDLQAAFELRDNEVRLTSLQATDDVGTIRGNALFNMEGWSPSNATMSVSAQDFPVRQEGSLVARITGATDIEAIIGDEGADATVDIESLAVRLPDEATRSLQSLEAHPDIRMVGLEQDSNGASESSYPVRLDLRSATPFWVRRNDFAAFVDIDLDVTFQSPDLRVAGYAELRRGTFDVVGKEFEVRQGALNFDGGLVLDPEVELTAAHSVRGFENVNVVLTVGDRLSTPSITFGSEGMACADRGQIVALLMSGTSCSEDLAGLSNANEATDIGAQAAGFLTGVFTGLGTLWAREQLGGRLPVVSIETLNSNLTSARVRAGYQFDEFIPESLRRVVRGMYLEGSVSVDSEENDSDARRNGDVGFLMRLQFPRNIVGEVAGVPSQDSWRVDVTWEP